MNSTAVSRILVGISDGSLARQAQALDAFFELPATAVSESERHTVLLASIKAMETSDNPYPLAERIYRFGNEVTSPLSELMNRNPSSEVKILASMMLLLNGSRLGVPVLVSEVEREGEYITLASFALANAGVTDHVPAIINRLRRWAPQPGQEFPSVEDDIALTLLGVINKLQIELPEDVRRKLLDPHAPQFVRMVVERDGAGALPH